MVGIRALDASKIVTVPNTHTRWSVMWRQAVRVTSIKKNKQKINEIILTKHSNNNENP